ncbi:hypothetical protein ACJZ2D_007249 [Fusarium nematophilum]
MGKMTIFKRLETLEKHPSVRLVYFKPKDIGARGGQSASLPIVYLDLVAYYSQLLRFRCYLGHDGNTWITGHECQGCQWLSARQGKDTVQWLQQGHTTGELLEATGADEERKSTPDRDTAAPMSGPVAQIPVGRF